VEQEAAPLFAAILCETSVNNQISSNKAFFVNAKLTQCRKRETDPVPLKFSLGTPFALNGQREE
jgi:hypothetical protein